MILLNDIFGREKYAKIIFMLDCIPNLNDGGMRKGDYTHGDNQKG